MSKNEKTTVEMLMVQADDARITIFAEEQNSGEPVTMNIFTQKFDSTENKFVADDEAYQKAIDTLTEIGLGEYVQNGEILTEDIDVDNKTFEAYTDPEDGRASLSPIRNIVRAEKVTTVVRNRLAKMNNEVFAVSTVGEFPGTRLEAFIEADVDGDGEYKLYRISSFEMPPVSDEDDPKRVPLKYLTNQLSKTRDGITNNTKLSAANRAKMERLFDKQLDVSRSRMIRDLNAELGIDFEADLLASSENEPMREIVPVRINVENTDLNGQKNYYLTAEVQPMGTEVTHKNPDTVIGVEVSDESVETESKSASKSKAKTETEA